jgi:hypothetical protein
MYLKQTNAQELGWRNGVARQAGPYLLISKAWLNWMPALSDTITNDMCPITITFPNGSRAVLPYVWHNDKITLRKPNGRDEYRVYIAAAVRSGQVELEPGDIVGFVQDQESPYSNALKMYCFRKGSTDHSRLNEVKPTAASYWEHNYTVTHKTEVVSQEMVTVDIDGINSRIEANQAPESVLASRLGQASFRDIVLAAYDSKCAVTGKFIRAGDFLNVEAAHIIPVAHGGNNLPSNGIALTRDLHWAFDKGAFTLTIDKKIEVHPSITSGELLAMNGKSIREPSAEFFAPAVEHIRYHRTKIYGMFLESGLIQSS